MSSTADALAEALQPAVVASLARQPAARAAFIGKHLLAAVEGAPPPLAPPYAPPAHGAIEAELHELAHALTGALNDIRGVAKGGDLMRCLAAHLIEDRDGSRRERAARYTSPEAIWSAIEAGDVALVRASWLLGRAGFEEREAGSGVWSAAAAEVSPLPSRQELEASCPEAFMPLDELKLQHRNFKFATQEAVGGAGDEPVAAAASGAEALPIVAVAHCWEGAAHPDPEGRTLRAVACELADGAWEGGVSSQGPRGSPTAGMPLYAAWGVKDVGVFLDW